MLILKLNWALLAVVGHEGRAFLQSVGLPMLWLITTIENIVVKMKTVVSRVVSEDDGDNLVRMELLGGDGFGYVDTVSLEVSEC